MSEKPNIKIFISYHKDSEIIESDILTPIHVGAASNKVILDMLRDDTGDNISYKNDKYCELTAQYWAWKNYDADYYGFMHYRRQFVFKGVKHEYDDGRPLIFECLDEEYKTMIGLDDEIIREVISDNDVILPVVTDTSTWGALSNEIQFSCLNNLHAKDFANICDLVCELYPDYTESVNKFRKSNQAYWYNMFIMKKEIFYDYCAWLFTILEHSEKLIDFSEYDQQERRVLAFMAERLQSIYLLKLKHDNNHLKIKEINITFVKKTVRPFETESYREAEEPLYCQCVQKAYGEIRNIHLPYDICDLFQYTDNKIDDLVNKYKLILYGGGDWCKQILGYFEMLNLPKPIEVWDQVPKKTKETGNIPVIKTDFGKVSDRKDYLWIITVRNKKANESIKKSLKENGAVHILENRTIENWLGYKIWIM